MAEELIKERLNNITTMIRYHNDKMVEAFNRFITFTIGIVGGTFWLISQDKIENSVKESVISNVPLLFWFLGISSLAIIYSNWGSWFGFRKAQSKLIPDIPEPSFPKSCKEQLIMVFIIFTVCIVFTWFSPINK